MPLDAARTAGRDIIDEELRIILNILPISGNAGRKNIGDHKRRRRRTTAKKGVNRRLSATLWLTFCINGSEQ